MTIVWLIVDIEYSEPQVTKTIPKGSAGLHLAQKTLFLFNEQE